MSSSTTQLKRNLGKMDLFGIAFGQVVGSGIMVLVGMGIAMTGRSVNLAFVLSAVWVILMSVPWIFISSCVRLRGGEYTQAAVLAGEKFAGIYIFVFLIRNLQMAVYALAFAGYFAQLVPGVNEKLVAILVATFFFVLNIFPTKSSALFQNIMVFILVFALVAFIAFGMPKVQPGYFSQPGFMTDGFMSFISASAFLTFATFGANSIFQLSGECKDPKRDIPFILIVATLSVAVLYGLIAMIAAGVLPLDQVSNQNLSIVAQEILPGPVYIIFIVGGALGAIATSLNATIAWVTKPILQACDDGWFPKQLAYLHPKYKTPLVLLAFYYVLTIVPIILDIPMDRIVNTVLVLMYACMIITSLGTMRLPKLFPEQWAKSPFKVNNGLLAFFCILASVVLLIQVYFNMSSLDTPLLIANVVILVVAVVFSLLRHKSGKVKVQISYEDD
ncbi:MAG: APC family permease [Lachnospiraceae bacterium]